MIKYYITKTQDDINGLGRIRTADPRLVKAIS
jgi:hypothetical protein